MRVDYYSRLALAASFFFIPKTNNLNTPALISNRFSITQTRGQTSELLLDDAVQVPRHVRRHVVGPVPGLPFPERQGVAALGSGMAPQMSLNGTGPTAVSPPSVVVVAAMQAKLR